jgi:hypothetical protein
MSIGTCVFAVLALSAASLPCPAFCAPQEPKFEEIRFHRVHLRNGNFIDGNLLRDTDNEVTIQIRIGEIVLRRELVDRIEIVKIRKISEPTKTVAKREPRPEPLPETDRPGPVPATPIRELKTSVVTANVPEAVSRKIDTLLGMESFAVSGEDRKALVGKIVALGREGVPYLNALLQQKAGEVPVDIIGQALGEIRDPSSVDPLLGCLQNQNYLIREQAVKALAALGFPEGVTPLIKALDDESSFVARSASAGLSEMARANPALGVPRKLEALLPKATSKGLHATTLGQIGDEDSRRTLQELLKSGDEDLTTAAIEGLSLCVTPEDAPAIHEVLNSTLKNAPRTACSILSRLKYRPAVPDLIRILGGEDKDLINSAHTTLKVISGEKFSADPATWQNWWENVGSKQP